MPEFVYALHDFQPENEDEIAFLAGDRIEVVEKDDGFGDGWWQGRNLQGHVGLFPQAYTAPAPSVAPDDAPLQNGSLLHPLDEGSETDFAPAIHAPIPKSPAILQQNGDHDRPSDEIASSSSTMSDVAHHRKIGSGSDGEMMKATMTDVQKAIEQLGRHDHEATEDGDGGRSFSFASSRDGGETETDTEYENSILDGDLGTAVTSGAGETFHTDARRRLADTARRAVEDAKKLAEIANSKPSDRRVMVPPIDCELSDESDDEDYQQHTESYRRTHPEIPEEDEEEIQEVAATNLVPAADANPDDNSKNENIDSSAYTTAQSSTSQSFANTIINTSSSTAFTNSPSEQTSSSVRSEEVDKARVRTSIPLYIEKKTSSETKPQELRRSSSPRSVGYVGVNSLDGVVRAVSPHLMDQYVYIPPAVEQEREKEREEKEKHPTEWTLEDVIEWLKSKGFDQDVQSKFIEQEITGDVLLDLDANLLKSEIGIMAFGKRARIANAIMELRGYISGSPSFQNGLPLGGQLFHSSPDPSHQSFPGSVSYHPSLHGMGMGMGMSMGTGTGTGTGTGPHSPLGSQFVPSVDAGHARSYSASQHSQRSIPGSMTVPGLPMLYSQSAPGGAGLPLSTSLPSPVVGSFGLEEVLAGISAIGGVGATDRNGGSGAWDSGRGSVASREERERARLGLEVREEERTHRPAHLSLSPSDGALSDTVRAVNGGDEGDGIEEEERGHMSENEMTTAKKARRRLFGLSQDSSVSRADSGSRTSKDMSLSTPPSVQGTPLVKDPVLDKEIKTYVRPKKNTEGKSGSERLSIFGATFPTSLGKGRKPPPRYSLEENSEKSSLFPLPRLGSTVGRKGSASIRSHTPNGSPKWLKEEKEKEPVNTLRKRSTSLTRSPGLTPVSPKKERGKIESPVIGLNGGSVPVKQGQSILDQIGEPDHTGWMRKKGDRYNTWRMRYLVLSGPHLYWLKNSSKSETKIKGYVTITGYKVTVDETVDPGKYGFRIEHDSDKTHYFSSDDKIVIRDWMKAIMKATIGRDYSKPVISSCNIPTIPLTVAQAMNPAPRPPSPSARAATQKAHRNKDLETLGVRDLNEVPTHATLVLMGLQPEHGSLEDRAKAERDDEDLGGGSTPKPTKSFGVPTSPAPPRPAREAKRQSARGISGQLDAPMIEWANSRLPAHLRVTNPFEQTFSALALFRLAESIKGQSASPPVPDSAFPAHPNDDKAIEGLFSLFDFLVNNEVKMGSVSINDIRLQRPDKVAQIVKALKNWEDRKRILAHGHFGQAGAFVPMNGSLYA